MFEGCCSGWRESKRAPSEFDAHQRFARLDQTAAFSHRTDVCCLRIPPFVVLRTDTNGWSGILMDRGCQPGLLPVVDRQCWLVGRLVCQYSGTNALGKPQTQSKLPVITAPRFTVATLITAALDALSRIGNSMPTSARGLDGLQRGHCSHPISCTTTSDGFSVEEKKVWGRQEEI